MVSLSILLLCSLSLLGSSFIRKKIDPEVKRDRAEERTGKLNLMTTPQYTYTDTDTDTDRNVHKEETRNEEDRARERKGEVFRFQASLSM